MGDRGRGWSKRPERKIYREESKAERVLCPNGKKEVATEVIRPRIVTMKKLVRVSWICSSGSLTHERPRSPIGPFGGRDKCEGEDKS